MHELKRDMLTYYSTLPLGPLPPPVYLIIISLQCAKKKKLMAKKVQHIVTCQARPVLIKSGSNVPFVSFFKFLYSPPVNGPKDPWPRVLSLPGAQGGFVGDPTLLARDNMFSLLKGGYFFAPLYYGRNSSCKNKLSHYYREELFAPLRR